MFWDLSAVADKGGCFFVVWGLGGLWVEGRWSSLGGGGGGVSQGLFSV